MAIRVLHVVPLAASGGTSGYTQRQIDELDSAGVVSRQVLFSGTQILKTPFFIIKSLKSISHEIQVFKPHIVHAHWGSLLALVTTIAARSGPPVIITFHGSDLNPVPSEHTLLSLIRQACSQLAALSASAVICVSDNLRKRLWHNKNFFKVIPCGTDLTRFRPLDQEKCRKKLNWDLTENVVFFHEGDRPKVKRRDLADQCINEVKKKIPSVRLEILGSHIPNKNVPTILNASDCLLMTSDFEGSPNIVREALACSLPVVSVDVGDVRYWSRKFKSIHLAERDPKKIAKKILACFKNSKRLKADKNKLNSFSTKTTLNKYLSLYKTVLNKKYCDCSYPT